MRVYNKLREGLRPGLLEGAPCILHWDFIAAQPVKFEVIVACVKDVIESIDWNDTKTADHIIKYHGIQLFIMNDSIEERSASFCLGMWFCKEADMNNWTEEDVDYDELSQYLAECFGYSMETHLIWYHTKGHFGCFEKVIDLKPLLRIRGKTGRIRCDNSPTCA
jgi:hypothetical protein